MSVGLAWKSAAKSSQSKIKKHFSYLGCPLGKYLLFTLSLGYPQWLGKILCEGTFLLLCYCEFTTIHDNFTAIVLFQQ